MHTTVASAGTENSTNLGLFKSSQKIGDTIGVGGGECAGGGTESMWGYRHSESGFAETMNGTVYVFAANSGGGTYDGDEIAGREGAWELQGIGDV